MGGRRLGRGCGDYHLEPDARREGVVRRNRRGLLRRCTGAHCGHQVLSKTRRNPALMGRKVLWLAMAFVLSGCVSGGSADSDLTAVEPPAGQTFSQDELGRIEADLRNAVAERVATCMTASGFEFRPYLPDDPNPPLMQYDGEEAFATDGYGVSTFWRERARGRSTDPNLDIVAGLAPADFESYQLSLNGNAATGAEGCVTIAGNEIASDSELSTVLTVSDSIGEGMARIDASEEVQETIQQWSRCMKDSGWEVDLPSDPPALVGQQLAVLSGRLRSSLGEGGIDAIRQMADSPLPQDISHDLDVLMEQERKMAVQDYRCYVEHVEPVRAPLVKRLEYEVWSGNGQQLQDAGYFKAE